MIYKVKLHVDSREQPFIDFYLKMESVTGFYIPFFDEEIGECINILHDGAFSTIAQEQHVTDYLYETFVKPCIEN